MQHTDTDYVTLDNSFTNVNKGTSSHGNFVQCAFFFFLCTQDAAAQLELHCSRLCIFHKAVQELVQHECIDEQVYWLIPPEGGPGMSDVSPLSGISGLSFDPTLLSPLVFFCLLPFLFLSCHFSSHWPILLGLFFFRIFSNIFR